MLSSSLVPGLGEDLTTSVLAPRRRWPVATSPALPAVPPRVLVVSTDIAHLPVLRCLLFGGVTLLACDAETVLQRVRNGDRFELIVSDLSMPGTDGIGLQRQLEAIDPDQARRTLFIGCDEMTAPAFLETVPGRWLGKATFAVQLRDWIVAHLDQLR